MIRRHDYSIDGGRSALFIDVQHDESFGVGGGGQTEVHYGATEIAGTATINGLHTDRPGIVALHVDPMKRRQGLGGALVQACLDEARRLGKRIVEVHVNSSNAAGRALYHRLGFTPRGILPGGIYRLTYRICRDTTLPLTPTTATA